MQSSVRRSVATVAAALTGFAAVGYAMAASGPASFGRRALAAARATSTARRCCMPGVLAGDGTGRRGAHHGSAAEHSPVPRSRLARRQVGGRLLAGSGIIVAGHDRPLPGVPASAYVVANARTGQVLAAKDPHGLYPPASTLKVLTAITMLPRLKPQASVVATRLAASVVPNVAGLIPGRRYKVSDLFRALLLISANDAAVALVQASGSYARGMALVNADARRLRAYDVRAVQPNGLDAPGQVVSAYDLALIARKALSMPAFMGYDSTLSAAFPVTAHKRLPMINQNALLTQYPGGIGGKIGWTPPAGATYIGMARRHGVTLIVTILHATPLTEIASAERLLNWGFAASGHVRAVGRLVPPLPGG
jgi:serine-type D-Ala-D-Ala carboxypeptidase (penicillin-binding protein 5/6)